MKIIIALLAAVFGASVAEVPGFIFGGVLGWVAAAYWSLQQTVDELRRVVDELRARRSDSLPSAITKPATIVTPAEPPPTVPMTTASPESLSAWGAPSPPTPATPRATFKYTPRTEPDWFDQTMSWLKEWFTGGNTLVRVGAVILFFGVSFLLKYAAEHSHVSIEMRLSGVVLGALALLTVGWRLRTKRSGYALALQGTAIGVLYLVIFAAFRLYGLLPASLAFGLLIAVCALASLLAILQNSQSFAVLGSIGGFLAPVLVSTGQGSHVALFSYYLLLNLGILAVAWFKAWRPLNVVGFISTFVIGTAWGVLRYDASLFGSTEPFLIAFFVLYVAIGLLFATRQSPQLGRVVDGTLVFGTPLVAFGLQAGMLRHDQLGLALSAVACGALYLSLAARVMRAAREGLRTLAQAYWALGVVFVTLAVPLALSGRWTAATWSLEGVAILWLGLIQRRWLARTFGVLLQLAAGLSLWRVIHIFSGGNQGLWLNALLLAAAAMISVGLLLRHREVVRDYERALPSILFFWSVLWWLLAWSMELAQYLSHHTWLHAMLVMMALTSLGLSALAQVLDPHKLFMLANRTALCLLPIMLLFALGDYLDLAYPAAQWGWAAWPVAFGLWYWVLKRDETICATSLQSTLHMLGMWLVLWLCSWQLVWTVDKWVAGGDSWPRVAAAVLPTLALFVLPTWAARWRWPFGEHRAAYLFLGGTGVVAYQVWWSLVSAFQADGNAAPLPYVPLLNPLDVTQLAVFFGVLNWWRADQGKDSWAKVFAEFESAIWSVAGAVIFIWANAVLLRTLHHWAEVPLQLWALSHSTLVQTSLSIFWTVLALLGMVVATRLNRRVLWFVGAGLMAVVVLKLFVVDLSSIGTVARIVSFMAVGGLMLLLGYLAPLPPAQAESTRD